MEEEKVRGSVCQSNFTINLNGSIEPLFKAEALHEQMMCSSHILGDKMLLFGGSRVAVGTPPENCSAKEMISVKWSSFPRVKCAATHPTQELLVTFFPADRTAHIKEYEGETNLFNTVAKFGAGYEDIHSSSYAQNGDLVCSYSEPFVPSRLVIYDSQLKIKRNTAINELNNPVCVAFNKSSAPSLSGSSFVGVKSLGSNVLRILDSDLRQNIHALKLTSSNDWCKFTVSMDGTIAHMTLGEIGMLSFFDIRNGKQAYKICTVNSLLGGFDTNLFNEEPTMHRENQIVDVNFTKTNGLLILSNLAHVCFLKFDEHRSWMK